MKKAKDGPRRMDRRSFLRGSRSAAASAGGRVTKTSGMAPAQGRHEEAPVRRFCPVCGSPAAGDECGTCGERLEKK
jgi:hypothetical protein